MKTTLHIDSKLLAKVMKLTGASSKTQAVDLALRETARREEIKKLAEVGLGLSPAELKDVFDPAYDLMEARIAEGAGKYGRGADSSREQLCIALAREGHDPSGGGRK